MREENQKLQERLKELHEDGEDDAASARRPAMEKEGELHATTEVTPANNKKSSIVDQPQKVKEE